MFYSMVYKFIENDRSVGWHYAGCRILDKFGLLRVENKIELEGMDPTTCGGHAFFYEPPRE